MEIGLATYLAAGERQLMLNTQKAPLPENLDGVDVIFVDREGTGLCPCRARKAIEAAKAKGLKTVVRTDGLASDELLKNAMLAPDGLVLPQVTSADELGEIVELLRLFDFCLIAQIETVEAVAALDELMAVTEIHAFLIGPNDLAHDMGYPGQPDHPEVRSTVETVAARLVEAGRVYGLPTLTSEARRDWSARGAQLHYVPLKAIVQMET